MSNVGLTYIDKNDLKPFGGNLEYLSLYINDIAELHGDLFRFNNKLKFVDLDKSKLEYIILDFLKYSRKSRP